MGRLHLECLGGENVYLCKKCNIYLTNHENLISDKFRGQTGTAYLFRLVVNIDTFEIEKKPMTTGYHMVRDIGCKRCKTRIGWMYELAFDSSQEYKEGHFIIEKSYIILVDGLPGDKNFTPYRLRRHIAENETVSEEFANSVSDFGYHSLHSFSTSNSGINDTTTNILLEQFGAATLRNIMSIARSISENERETFSNRREFNNISNTRPNRYGFRLSVQNNRIGGNGTGSNYSRYSNRHRGSR